MKFFLIFLVGIAGGFINTLAGSGSILILPLLVFSGLSPITANGTLRLGILFQSITAVREFKKNRIFDFREAIKLSLPAFIGSVFGSLTAVNIPEKIMNYFISALLIFMLFLIIFKPQRWLKPSENKEKPYFLKFFVLFIVGFYGGFIQAGVGFFLIAALVFVANYDLVKANAVKMFIVMIYTPVALLVFALNSQTDYIKGFILSAGMVIGAFIASKLAIKKGAQYVRIFLIIAILLLLGKILIQINFF